MPCLSVFISIYAMPCLPTTPYAGGAMKLKGPQLVVSELFIYTLIGCSCFTVSVIRINEIN